jgi:hypothetical protein
MPLWPQSSASEICPIAAQLAHLHRRLGQTTRLRAPADPTALAIYVHALATEDVIVQVVLRGTQPLMLEHLPQLKAGASWQTDPDTVRQYANVTRAATRTYLARFDLDGKASRPDAMRERPGPLSAFGILRVLLIPVLERATREISELPGNRSTGGAAPPSRGGGECSDIVASSNVNDASVSPLPLGNRQADHRRRPRSSA